MNTSSPFLAASSKTGATPLFWDEVVVALGDRKVDILVVGDGEALVRTSFGPSHPGRHRPDDWIHDPKDLAAAVSQLEAYSAGELTEFDLPLRPAGSEFQLRVWRALMQIPYGTTTTYGRIAAQIGHPTGSRAVGAAIGANPIGIVVPCHRVIGANGSLTGYAGGLDNKVALLHLEGVTAL
jgi:methylated-DNA-[protein]-cysteine S-methyltransferase